MCGIVGVVDERKDKAIIIKKMADRMVHRGPDEEGYYMDEEIALGHRRLSIIDLENGKQPMLSRDRRFALVFNGEIYNYLELRRELEKKNYIFTTKSDTEVLLHGYEEWGEELPKKLQGMFAFAIWDAKNKKLFCCRDHFGMKPFYYYKTEHGFMFSSEIKTFLEHPDFKKVLNKKLLGPYLSFSFIPTAETFFKGVYTLEPGTSLNFHNGELTLHKYYDIHFEEKNKSFQKFVEEIDKTMERSIKQHLLSDVEVGAFLSSGVDSSYIVSLAKPKNTYTVGYHYPQYSEIRYTKNLCNQLGLKNITQKITKEEYMQAVPKILYHMDEPFSDPAAISLYFLSKLASIDVKVVLSGEGADEFFGGYNTYREEVDFQFYNKIPYGIRHFMAKCLKHFPEFKGRNFIVRRGNKIENEYVGVNKILSEKEIQKILNVPNLTKIKDVTKPLLTSLKETDHITKMQAIDIKLWLVKDILLKADKMTMANSIEARMPFVDKKVFAVASTIPAKYKVSKTNTKLALRQAAKMKIPNEAYKKKKLGFPVPLREWIREDDVYEEIYQTICQDFVKEFFNQRYILKLLEQHRQHKKDNYKKVWAVYCFIKWYEVFFNPKTLM